MYYMLARVESGKALVEVSKAYELGSHLINDGTNNYKKGTTQKIG